MAIIGNINPTFSDKPTWLSICKYRPFFLASQPQIFGVPPLGLRRRVVPVGQATVPSLANTQRTAEPAAWEGGRSDSGGKVEINHDYMDLS